MKAIFITKDGLRCEDETPKSLPLCPPFCIKRLVHEKFQPHFMDNPDMLVEVRTYELADVENGTPVYQEI